MKAILGALLVFLVCLAAVAQEKPKPLPKDIPSLMALVKKRDAKAQYMLGAAYYFGEGVDVDFKLAVDWYKKSAEQGHAKAQYSLGAAYWYGKGVPKDLVQTYMWWTLSAGNGYALAKEWLPKISPYLTAAQIAEAMVELAEAHYWGRGADLNRKQSFTWAEKASWANHPVASYRMGVQYLLGHGVEEDIGLGQQLINLSSDGMEKRAKAGDHRAQFYIAIMYHYGIGRMESLVKARRWMTLAAEGGHVDAQFYMGRMCAFGAGVKRDITEAKRWWRMAAEQGHVLTQYSLGKVLLQSKNKVEHPEGIKLLKKAVDRKLDRAEFFMGEVALRGINIPKNDTAAFKYFEKSANQGYLRGQYSAGQALAKGVGVKSDPVAANVWLTLAARAGNRGAIESKRDFGAELTADQLLEIRRQSGKFQAAPSLATRKSRAGLMAAGAAFLLSLGIEELKKHAASGDRIAKVRLAEMYFNGMRIDDKVVLPQNLKECLRLNKELAAAGHVDSQWNHALFNLKGVFQQQADGTRINLLKENPIEAAKWLRKAAAKDHAGAMFVLGGLYETGKGVPLDYKKAMDWFEKAADQGDAQACRAIAIAYLNGRGTVVPVNKPKAIQWLRRGADKGDPQSQYSLGTACLNGEGMEKNPDAARKWFLRAAWQNEPRAQLQLGRMLRDGLGGSKDMARAAMWINLAANNQVVDAVVDFDAVRDQLSREENARTIKLVRSFVPKPEHREVNNPSDDDLAKTKTLANKGDKEAQYQLGLRHLNGTGVRPDHVQACIWFKLAAQQGHALALKEYDKLGLKMTNEEIVAADKAVDEFKPSNR